MKRKTGRRHRLVTNKSTPVQANQLQALTWNLSTKLVRNDTMEGRHYTVVPMVMMVEGVHTGSQGPLYYSARELGKVPEVWNHKPIVVYHPNKDGEPVSACSPAVISNCKIGVIMNAKFDRLGRLTAEAWLEEDRVKAVDIRVWDAVQKQEQLELSTGVFTDNIMGAGEWEGEHYVGQATNLRPDHLAVLPDEVGACSKKDGAGFIRNAVQGQFADLPSGVVEEAVQYALSVLGYDPGESRDQGGKWTGGSGGIPTTYPRAAKGLATKAMKASDSAATAESHRTASSAHYRAADAIRTHGGTHKTAEFHSSMANYHSQVASHLKAGDMEGAKSVNDPRTRGKATNNTNPHQDRETGVYISSGGTPQDIHRRLQQRLKAAQAAGDKEQEDKLQLLLTKHQQAHPKMAPFISQATKNTNTMNKADIVADLIANHGYAEADREGLMDLEEPTLKSMHTAALAVTNQHQAALKTSSTPTVVVLSAQDQKRYLKLNAVQQKAFLAKKAAVLAANAVEGDNDDDDDDAVDPDEVTTESYIANAPAGIRDVLLSGITAHNAQKAALVTKITANKANRFSKETLEGKTLEDLEGIAALAAVTANSNPEPTASDYSGLGNVALVDNTKLKTEDALLAPVLDFSRKSA